MPRPSPRLSLGRRTGVIFALAALVLGGLTASAMGWGSEKEKGKGRGHKETTTPTHTVPQTPTQPVPTTPTPPPAPPAPAAPAAPAPVTPQGGPTGETPSPVSGPTRRVKRTPAAKRGGPALVNTETTSPVAATPSIAPAAEQSRKTLALTGFSPVLMALLGAILLGGGALFLRKARA